MTSPRPHQAPIVPGPPILGHLVAWWRDPIRVFAEGWRRYGDVVGYPFGGRPDVYAVIHPDHVQHVLQDHHQAYGRFPPFNDKLKGFLGEGLLTSEGPYWHRQRRLLQPTFHRHRLLALGAAMSAAATEVLEHWRPRAGTGRPFDLASELQHLTLTVAARALFGADLGEQTAAFGEATTICRIHTNRRIEAFIDPPVWLPLPSTRQFHRARHALDSMVYALIARRRRAGPSGGADLLSMLLEVQDAETSRGMTDEQVRDEALTLLVAGQETTATALTWTFYLLSTHPEIARRTRDELAAVLGERAPTVEDLPRLPYLGMVIQESMRLYPPVWAFVRMALSDDDVGGYVIPRGAIVALVPYLTHRHPSFWDNPEGFEPERFAPEHAAGRPRYAYFPFGGGPRRCLGRDFALLELPLVVALALQRYQFDVAPGYAPALAPKLTLHPRHGMPMLLNTWSPAVRAPDHPRQPALPAN